jgi:alpha-methylacyl-CoA racemase
MPELKPLLTSRSRSRSLDGIRVLDLTRFLPGAVATMLLRHFGAEVIKIERPGAGDPGRTVHGASWSFAATNRGKKSVAINLKDARGKELFGQLASTADVVVESFRPGVMSRLGIGCEDLLRQNARLIYAALSGYGQSGQWAGLAGHDINYIAMSGLLELISPPGYPMIPEIQIADIAGGSLPIVLGILLALRERDLTGRGQRVDVSMVDELKELLTLPLAALHNSGHVLSRGRELLSGGYACYHPYRAKDGRWLVVGALEPKFWANLCWLIGCPELIPDQFSSDPRQGEVKQKLANIFITRTAVEWFSLLGQHDCCVTPVRTLEQAVSNGHFGRNAHGPDHSAEQASAPEVGEHSLEILKRCGIPESELLALRKEQVIAW